MSVTPRTDVHQHVWTEPLVAALARRREGPRVRRSGGDWVLELAGEPAWPLPRDGEDGGNRAALVAADGLDRALVSLSSPLGIEALPADEARPLIDAFHAGVRALPEATFGFWGAVPVADPEPAEVDVVLAGGAAGVSLPAQALATPAAVERMGPVLERLGRRGAPLFVHPGPAPAGPDPAVPAWWPALTSYVAGQSAAWHAFAAVGRRNHPELRVVFAMLAGCAPVHAERLAARGAPVQALDDRRVFYDTSSYGPHAIGAVAGVVGSGQLVFGSDRPVVRPASAISELAQEIASFNVVRLLHGDRAAAVAA